MEAVDAATLTLITSQPHWWADVLALLAYLHTCDGKVQPSIETLVDWESYFHSSLAPALKNYTKPFAGLPVTAALLSDAMCRPLTLLAALRNFGLLPASGSVVVIHVLGAAMEAEYALPLFAELTTLLPSARIELFFCGPECFHSEPFEYRNLSFTFKRGLYHDLHPHLCDATPDMAVGFNMGYTETWRDTVRLLQRLNIPTVVTGAPAALRRPLFVVPGLDASEVDFARRAMEEDLGSPLPVLFAGRNPFGSRRQVPAPGGGMVASNSHWLGFWARTPGAPCTRVAAST